MAQDKLQLQRFELKYVITERVAERVRDFVGSYLEIDEYGASRPNLSYPVHSIYLDSDDLSTYQSTVNGTKNRYKLRLRFYDDNPETPVFFEIKRRVNNCILKQRGGVRRNAVQWLLAGHLPEQAHLISKEAKQMVALQRFSMLLNELHAKPKGHVAYLREAWVNPHDNSVRVTMDRDMVFDRHFSPTISTRFRDPVMTFGKQVILELKFTNRFPDWFRELVRIFSLMQFSASKYAEGITLVGEHRFHNGESIADAPTFDQPPGEPDFGLSGQGPEIGTGGARTAQV
jgi:VTC domain